MLIFVESDFLRLNFSYKFSIFNYYLFLFAGGNNCQKKLDANKTNYLKKQILILVNVNILISLL